MIALAAEDVADLRRWLIAGAVIVCAHGAIAAALVRWHEPLEAADSSGAVVVEFAPEQIAALAQPEQEAVPEKPIEKVEKVEEQKPEANGEEQIEEKVEPKPEEQPRDALEQILPTESPKVAALPAAPVQGPSARVIDTKALQTWVGEIAAVLERKKRYPAGAHARREQGTAQVAFTLDRQGHVIESRIARSSGAPDLDQEALALVRRAQPFPPSPAGAATEEHVDLTVPVQFNLK